MVGETRAELKNLGDIFVVEIIYKIVVPHQNLWKSTKLALKENGDKI